MTQQIVQIKLSSWLPIKNLAFWYVVSVIGIVFLTGIMVGVEITKMKGL